MTIDGRIWERYDRAAQGLLVDSDDDFEWMIEDGTEFDFRMLLRHFDHRDELLDRIGRHEHDPSPAYTDSEVEDLAMSLAAAYTRVAAAYAPERYEWAQASHRLRFRYVDRGYRSASNDAAGIRELITDAALSDLDPAGLALFSALVGQVQSIGICYLLGPIMSVESDFGADLALRKSGRAFWIEDAHVCVRRPVVDPWAHLDDSSGWDPKLDWPSNDDIARHLAQQP